MVINGEAIHNAIKVLKKSIKEIYLISRDTLSSLWEYCFVVYYYIIRRIKKIKCTFFKLFLKVTKKAIKVEFFYHLKLGGIGYLNKEIIFRNDSMPMRDLMHSSEAGSRMVFRNYNQLT